MTAMTAQAGPFGFSDAARRISDGVRQAIVDGHRDQWMAFALDDGRTDGRCYLTKSDAVRFNMNRYNKFMYLKVPWDDVTPRAAEVFLKIHRQQQALGQHPVDLELGEMDWFLDTRREVYPELDRRRFLVAARHAEMRRAHAERRTRGGLILP